MGYTVKQVSSFIPEPIRETPFFQECIANLRSLPREEIDHYGVEVCRQKTGHLLADQNWIRKHPRFAELSAYKHQILKSDFQNPDQAAYARRMLEILDRDTPVNPKPQVVAEEVSRPVAEVPEESKVLPTVSAVKIEPVVLMGKSSKVSGPVKNLEKALGKLTLIEAEALQTACVRIQTQYFIEQGMNPNNARKSAMNMLGSTGVDGVIGRKTKNLISNVLNNLSESQRIHLVDVKDVSALRRILHIESLRTFVKETPKDSV